MQDAIHTTLMEQDLEWPEDLESVGKKHVSSRLPSRAPDIPVVHVCVQGGWRYGHPSRGLSRTPFNWTFFRQLTTKVQKAWNPGKKRG